ncbi:exodeoxyribonuclease VII large subunit [Jiella sp. MQZ9-1]|uniref:Exodeoxyribonuclease 7 large subunit n=1 Tax=Jiella flava TaxID=2816857 RepID=A0A939FVR8_9HYPH|nr:exodeoxyribonuclease VII large subunit [Jiella flava]MBO0661151.1 exodeoxyribonuclease VII large subunit [Jiella flava]MCD2469797.1 exodeoxyribonuclease VII large subunit [Jiella flava]
MSRSAESIPASNVAEYSVSEISGALKRTVEDTFGHVRVRGEVSGYRGPHSSGHAYFALKDERARIDAVIWRGAFSKLAFKPEEGLEVIATGRLTTYPNSSKYQIVIETIEPAGAGALMALLNERRQKLEAEGLFADERKRPLPFLPRIIGVVTSPTGAVIRDIVHRISDRFPVHVLVWPVRVQGETCGAEVSAAIEGFNAIEAGGPVPRPDLLIVARGGGSLEDLWGFNDEAVVRAAAASQIPLIAAVGHETDWTLIDHAADRRAPTPTGAAEMAVPVRADLQAALASHNARLSGAVSRRLDQERKGLAALLRAMPGIEALLEPPRRRLDEATTALGSNLRHAVGDKRRAFTAAAARLAPATLEAGLRDKRAALRHHAARIDHGARLRLDDARRRLDRLAAGLKPHMLKAKSEAARVALGQLGERLERAETQTSHQRRQRLEGAWRLAASLSPLNVLERGYVIVRDGDGAPVTRAGDLYAGMPIALEFAGRQSRAAIVTEGSVPAPQSEGAAKPADAPKRRKPARTKSQSSDQGSLF